MGRLYDNCTEELYDETGMTEGNLTKREERGLNSLKVKDGSLVICQTD
jgi:hypothetical protein